MQEDTDYETGWGFVAQGDSIATMIDTLLRLDPADSFSRSELAEETGIPLKTLHLMDDVERAVEIGLLEKHQQDGEEVHYTVNEDSDVLAAAEGFGDAVRSQREN